MKTEFLGRAHNKKIGWRFFRAEYVHEDYHPDQPLYNLDDLIEQAKETRNPSGKLGKDLATYLGGEFTLAASKTPEQALSSLIIRHGIQFTLAPEGFDGKFVSGISDLNRGVIVVKDNHALLRARKKLRDIVDCEQNVIAKISDNAADGLLKGVRGIFAYVQTPNKHITEMQIHTRQYWEGLAKVRMPYEEFRRFVERSNLHQSVEHYARFRWDQNTQPEYSSPDWSEETQFLLRRARHLRAAGLEQLARDTHVKELELTDTDSANSCSFPLRKVCLKGTGTTGYLVAATHLKDVMKWGVPWYDPTWAPPLGP